MVNFKEPNQLVPTVLQVPLYGGQDSGMDRRLVDVGSVSIAENLQLSVRGQAQKRNGYASTTRQRTDGTTMTGAVQVFSGGGSNLFQHDGLVVSNYSPAAGVWAPLGDFLGAQMYGQSAVPASASVGEVSSASTNSYQAVVWTEGTTVYLSIIETATGSFLQNRTTIAGNSRSPLVVAWNGDFYIFWAQTSPSSMFFSTFVRGTNPFAIPTAIVAVPVNPSSVLAYDVTIDTINNRILGIFDDQSNPARSGAAGYYQIFSFDSALAATVLFSAPTATKQIPRWTLSVGPALGTNNFFWEDGESLSTLTGFNLPGRSAVGLRRVASTSTGAAFFEVFKTSVPGGNQGYTVVQAGTIAQDATFAFVGPALFGTGYSQTPAGGGLKPANMRLASKPFVYAGNSYCWIVSDSLFESQYFLIDQNGQIVGNALNNGGGAPFDGIGISLSAPTSDADANFSVAFRTVIKVGSTTDGPNSTTQYGIVRRSLQMGDSHIYCSQLDGVTYFSGPAPKTYDGSTLTEWGFYDYPNLLSTSLVAGSPGLLNGGIYTVYLVYSAYDATGKLWRSATSFPQTVTVAASGKITVTVPYLQTTARTNVMIEIYCTANVGGQTGIVPFLVGTVPNVPVAATTSINGVSTPVTQTTFDINLTDALLSRNEQLYITQNGGNSFATPPPSTYQTTSGTRLYALSNEQNQVYVTTIAAPSSPLNFILTQAVNVPGEASTPNALGILDGLLFIATTRFWYVTNADTNDLSAPTITFAPPRRLPFDTGVQSPPSVISTTDGIYFQGQRGIILLDRRENLLFIGDAVKNYNADIIDSYISGPNQQIRFLVEGGPILNYDYQWKVWTQSVFADAPVVPSICRWNDQGVMLMPNGMPRLETVGLFFDDTNVAIRARLETPWIKPGGIAGWARTWSFMILGELRSPHTLQVRIAYQYSETTPGHPDWLDTLTIASTQVYGTPSFGGGLGTFGAIGGFGTNSAGNAYQFLASMPRPKAGSFKFEITDVNSTGEDFALSILALYVGVLPGISQVPTWKKFG
jgi:hypothetical protein